MGLGRDRMRVPLLLLTAMFALAACESPNFSPGLAITISAPVRDDDAKKVDEAISSLGFARLEQSGGRVELSTGSAVVLTEWQWPARMATRIDVLRMLNTGEYIIGFYDNEIHGWTMNGPPCRKYLDLVAALQKQYAAEPHRVKAARSCDPNGLDDTGRQFKE
jgi:hypothetical protein